MLNITEKERAELILRLAQSALVIAKSNLALAKTQSALIDAISATKETINAKPPAYDKALMYGTCIMCPSFPKCSYLDLNAPSRVIACSKLRQTLLGAATGSKQAVKAQPKGNVFTTEQTVFTTAPNYEFANLAYKAN